MKARFLLGPGGGRGVLTGLVLVGVSINLQKIVSDPSSGLPRGGSSGAAGGRAHGVHLAPRAGAGHDGGGGGGAGDGACRLGVCCGHPAAAAEELEDHKARSARGLRASGGLRPGRHAAAGYRWRRCAGRGAGGLYWLVPGTFSRSSWLCLPRRCCSSRSTGSNRPGIPIALSARMRGMRSANFAH
jgi:hypothetical protein